jgi:hypothetical protein
MFWRTLNHDAGVGSIVLEIESLMPFQAQLA